MATFLGKAGYPVQITFHGRAGNQKIYNVLTFMSKSVFVDRINRNDAMEFNLTSILDQVNTAGFWGKVCLAVGTNYYLDRITVRVMQYVRRLATGIGWKPIWGAEEVRINNPVPAEMIGQRPGDTLPSFNAITIQKKTTNATRVGKGAMRLSTIAEPDASFQVILPAEIALAQTAGDTVLKTEVTANATPAQNLVGTVWSPKVALLYFSQNGTPNDTNVETSVFEGNTVSYGGTVVSASNKITTAVVNEYIGRQVSRQQRGV